MNMSEQLKTAKQNGTLTIAVDAIRASSQPHRFLSLFA